MRKSRLTLADQKLGVPGPGRAVQAGAWLGDVGLQVESGGLRCPLLVAGSLARLAVSV